MPEAGRKPAKRLPAGEVELASATKAGSVAVAPDALVARDPSRTRSSPTGATVFRRPASETPPDRVPTSPGT